ncbi:MAG: amino acid adenylation domain-containing protein [Lachnospiraceae bacterium]|nr:amino acid adenylation domain-containing protein [Lachnospiraceae bacterium]
MDRTVVSYFKNTAERYGSKMACADDVSSMSYKELWEESHIISGNLLKYFEVRKPIPVLMKKSCRTLSVMWGIIKAGCCYVIIDPMLPKERICAILNTLQADYIVTEESFVVEGLPKGIKVIHQERLRDAITETQKNQVENRIRDICDIDPLYIMFTSGSTGVPKGVVVNHRSVIDFIECFVENFHITEKDVIGNQAPWDFDVSVKDIFSAVKTGATVQIIAKKYFSFPIQLAELLEERKVTTLIWAVSALCILSSKNVFSHIRPKCIEKIIFSGEVMPVNQYNIWRRQYPEALFVNVYGPTEITCNCTYCVLKGEYMEGEVLPIGKAFSNERVFLLDEQDCLIEKKKTNVKGEICVSGTAVSMGYYNATEETERHFVQNPLNKMYREIIYRTGDIGYYNKDGELCFLARKDFQIKYMGHRIELGEIERAFYKVSGIRQICCIYHKSEIFAFVVGDTDTKKITREIRKILPQYMLPSHVINMNELPLNNNGKIDRKGLVVYLEREEKC